MRRPRPEAPVSLTQQLELPAFSPWLCRENKNILLGSWLVANIVLKPFFLLLRLYQMH
jgi:hypothetical protein